MILESIISQSNGQTPLFFTESSFDVGKEIERTGVYSECYPRVVTVANKTFTTAIEPYETTNNRIIVFEIENENVSTYELGNGTGTQDVYNHPRPIIYADNSGYLWVLQVDGHYQPINVYKSNGLATISSGFTFQGQINITSAYLSVFSSDDTVLKIVTRSANVFGHRLITVDLNNLAQASFYDVTNPVYSSTNIRHYHSFVCKYGARTREWFIINHRYDINNNIFKSSCYYIDKSAPMIVGNKNNTYTKNISISQITEQELEDNDFAISGTNANTSIHGLGTFGCQIGNDFYAIEQVSEGNWVLFRIDSNFNKTQSSILPSFQTGLYPIIDYNGLNLVVNFVENNTVKIYAVSLDLSSIVLKKTISVNENRQLDFPSNLNTLNSNYNIIKRYDSQNSIYYINTNDKFNL